MRKIDKYDAGSDSMSVAGRLKAAMGRAGLEAKPQALIAALQKKTGKVAARQTVHNWFKPTCKFIEPVWLYAIAETLDVTAKWIAINEGPIERWQNLDDQESQLLATFRNLPDHAKPILMAEAEKILKVASPPSRVSPLKR